jgi:hypothetical protein
MLAVASSNITTLLFLNIALHIHINYFSPELKLDPFSEIYIRIPFSSLSSKSCKLALFNSSSILESDTFPSGSKLNLSVPVNIVGSYGITVILALNSFKSKSLILTPSTNILPSTISTILLNDKQIVLFPAPVLPTTPIFSPG